MKKILFISAIILTAASTALSQSSSDALRFSRIDIGGTARYMGLSGAFGALGGDFTASSTNPAGIGLYKSSEFTNTPAVNTGVVKSEYNGISGSDQRTNFYLGNIGIVLSTASKANASKQKKSSVTFATGLNRLNDFNRRYEMTGPNTSNSLLDIYVNDANGTSFNEIEDDLYGDYAFDLNLAWWDYLLDLADPNVDDQYISPVPAGNKLQTKTIDNWGSMNEYVISLGFNINERLYFGQTIGIPFIRYYESSVYTENGFMGNTDLKYFNRIEDLETRGSGFNFKFGLIYRASDWFRIGAAFHTPSWYHNMKDYWQVTMISEFNTPDADNNYRYVKSSPQGEYDYSLQTPYRVQGNMAFIIGNIGLVSADYEFANFASASLDASDYNFSQENTAIDNSYKIGSTIRVGTEWRYNIFSFRAGGKYFTSPYQDQDLNDGSGFGFSGGWGLKTKWFFMDLAYAYSKMEDNYYFYNSDGIMANPVANSTINHSVLLTLGVKL